MFSELLYLRISKIITLILPKKSNFMKLLETYEANTYYINYMSSKVSVFRNELSGIIRGARKIASVVCEKGSSSKARIVLLTLCYSLVWS